MVVCKFFQQGSCRYGQNCRFEHVYGSKYSYHSNAPPQAASATPAVTDEQLINQVHSDVQSVLRGGQWILSSYAPFKEKAAFPDIMDLSPEEARLFIYEAKAANNLDQAISYMNNLYKESRMKYEQLLQKNVNITRVFRGLYNGENVTSPFSNMTQENSKFENNNPASSVFRSAVKTTPFSQNNQTPSLFSLNNPTPVLFAQNSDTNADPAKSIFAQATQSSFNTNGNGNIFGIQNSNNITDLGISNSQPNIFGPQKDSSAKSIFAQATQNVFPASTPLAVQASPGNLFASASQSIFAQNQQTPFSQNQVFQKPEPQNIFPSNQQVFQQVNTTDTTVYSRLEELPMDYVEAFKSNNFKMGFVPEMPPPHSLCF